MTKKVPKYTPMGKPAWAGQGKDTLDDILDKLAKDVRWATLRIENAKSVTAVHNYHDIRDVEIDGAKQSILKHYISYDELDRLIGKDKQSESNYEVDEDVEHDCPACANRVLAELRTALKKSREL